MKTPRIVIGLLSLSLLQLSGCGSAPPLPAQQLTSSSCPPLTPCRLPASNPNRNGDLMADLHLVEKAWALCAAKVDSQIDCAERDRQLNAEHKR